MKKGIFAGVFSAIGGAAAGSAVTGMRLRKQMVEKQELVDKHLALYLMMNQWVKVKQQNKNLADYFERQGYHEIAIYGMHFAGETLVDELQKSSIHIKYGIDKNAERIYADFDIVTPDSELEPVDAIVVTPITYFNEIETLLMDKTDCPIVSLEDILYQI